MSKRFLQLICLIVIAYFTSCKTKDQWKSRSIIQVLTDRYARTDDTDTSPCDLKALDYCHGTYRGMINKLSYIENMGFNAIWISPIIENTDKGFHGYHFKNLYTVNTNFGTEEDLFELIAECHKRDIWVMVDVVANHAGMITTGTTKEDEVDHFEWIYPFDKEEYYHTKCIIGDKDWDTNQYIVENCRLANLPDLKQENYFVKETLLNWIRDLIKKYDFDGIRIDTIPEVPTWFWSEFVEAAGVFQIGEVFNSRIDYVASYQNFVDAVFNYPLYYAMNNSFCDGAHSDFPDRENGDFNSMTSYFTKQRNSFNDVTVLGVFLENHDNARFLSSCLNNHYKFRNAIVFSLLWEGIPVYYYGAEQYYNGRQDPYNREPMWEHMNPEAELYKWVGIVNKIRKDYKLWNTFSLQLYQDKYNYAFSRGKDLIVATTNIGSAKETSFTIKNKAYKQGMKFCNALKTDDCITVNTQRELVISMIGEPKVYLRKKE